MLSYIIQLTSNVIYVCLWICSGLAWGTDDATLKEAFSNFGEVTEGMESGC